MEETQLVNGCTANGSKSERDSFVDVDDVDDDTLSEEEDVIYNNLYENDPTRGFRKPRNKGRSLVSISCLESSSAFIEISPTRSSAVPRINGPEKRSTVNPRIWFNNISRAVSDKAIYAVRTGSR